MSLLGRKEGNVLFNDALNTFYLRFYGIGHMVKDNSDSERGNLLPSHGYSFELATRVLLYALSHRQNSTYHSLCYTSHGALARCCKITFAINCSASLLYTSRTQMICQFVMFSPQFLTRWQVILIYLLWSFQNRFVVSHQIILVFL